MLVGPLLSAIVFWILAGDLSTESDTKKKNEMKSKKEQKSGGIENEKEGEEKCKDGEKSDQKSDETSKDIDESVLREKVCYNMVFLECFFGGLPVFINVMEGD